MKHVFTLIAAVIASSLPAAAFAYDGEALAKNAKITIVQARATALKLHPGTIVSEELEVEDGGSGLRYTFDIKLGGTTHEVGIDAKTGATLEDGVD